MSNSMARGGLLRRALASASVLACATVTLGVATAGAPAVAYPSMQVTAERSGPDHVLQRIADSWTPERMRAAVPLDVLSDGGAVSLVRGRVSETRRAAADAVPASNAVKVPRSVGKLFFRDGASDYVCSAAAIDTPTRNLVLTAGHCVHTGADPSDSPLGSLLGGLFGAKPHYFSDWVFVPRYRNGNAPYGKWVGKGAWAPDGWREATDFAEDQGVVKVAKLDEKRLVKVVGGNEVRYGASPKQGGVRVWGWPAESPFDGESGWRCDGDTKRADDGDTPSDAQLDCNLNGGASGGPWLMKKGRTKNAGVIWAVTSRRSLNSPVLYASPLGEAVKRLIKSAS